MLVHLMHKNIQVALMDVSIDGGLGKVQILNQVHTPLGGQMNMMKFHDWWKDRATPKTRKGASHALRLLGQMSTNSMLVNNLALSLTDCYWICPVNSGICWEQVSLFRNNFVDIFGELTFDTSRHIDLRNKTLFKFASSQGELQKKWCIDSQGRRFLVKGNWGSSYQQSLNEILATEIHKRQGVNCFTPYFLTQIDVDGGEKGIGCYSYNFCNENIESIPAWEVLNTVKLNQATNYYETLKKICVERFGFDVDYVDRFLGYEILTDYIITNTDRHMNNIHILRNPDTLQYIGFAPIFDSGNSMFFRAQNVPSGNFHKIETHSFLKYEVKMLQYVKDRNIVNLDKLPDANYLYNLYSKDVPERHCRIEPMIKAYNGKINSLRRFQNGENIWKSH